MQVRIAMYLRQQNYYGAVEVEYAVPLELIGYAKLSRRNTDFEGRKNNFTWPNDIYADIVVMKDNQFAIVELKYGTRAIRGQINPSRFGLDTKISIVKTKVAQDITMYNS